MLLPLIVTSDRHHPQKSPFSLHVVNDIQELDFSIASSFGGGKRARKSGEVFVGEESWMIGGYNHIQEMVLKECRKYTNFLLLYQNNVFMR